MSLWIESTIVAKIPISEMLVKEKAKFFMQALNINESDLKLSNGWIEKFKRCNNLHVYHLHREAGSASLETLHEERQKLQNLLRTYRLKPWVIGKSPRPRYFKCINLNSLPVEYRANEKAWMHSNIFEE
ncbi:7189_t:CDS:2, partial [Racocetra persica]